MAELATIARPYAEALFKSARADLNAAAAWLEPIADIAENAQLQQFASNPKVSDVQVFDVISGVAKVTLPDNARNFLRTVIENGRLSALPEIACPVPRIEERTKRVFRCDRVQRFPYRCRRVGRSVGRA
jgi:F-type H+-transporting ATPase subunit delta